MTRGSAVRRGARSCWASSPAVSACSTRRRPSTRQAYAWHPRWPILTLSIGAVATDGGRVRPLAGVLPRDAGARAACRGGDSRQDARVDLPRAARAGDRRGRSTHRRGMASRRRVLLEGVERNAARTPRRGLGRCRKGGQAALQRPGAQAGGNDRLPPHGARRRAREVRGGAPAESRTTAKPASISGSCSPICGCGIAPPTSSSRPPAASRTPNRST